LLVPPFIAEILVPPLWFWLILVAVWLTACGLVAAPVVYRLGPRRLAGVVRPGLAGLLAVPVVAVLPFRVDVLVFLLLSFALAVAAAVIQGRFAKSRGHRSMASASETIVESNH
jgi:hypothetical protein